MPHHPLKNILPDFPRTRHIPWKPNASSDDLVATTAEISPLITSDKVSICEKIDGSNCGMALHDGEPVIRNHNHILNKGFHKETPAKMQFSSVFTWFYKNKFLFERLNELADCVSVYGEWMFAVHGKYYDKLPSLLIAFDLYDYGKHEFLASHIARPILAEAGFVLAPELFYGSIDSFEQLENLCNQPSEFAAEGNREGIYAKVNDDSYVTHRFKMVREDFVQGGLWDKKILKKNKVKK